MSDGNTWLLIFIVVLLLWSLGRRGNESAIYLRRLDRKLDAIVKSLDIKLNADVDPRVVALAAAGKKIAAIKLYREQTGVGLKEAKEFVEGL